MGNLKIKKIDPSQIRYTPEEGELIQTPEGNYMIWHDGSWNEIKMENGGINMGLYDMNKQMYDMQCNVSQTQRAVVQNQKNWKCNKCGTENASYVGTCSCGASRPTK